MKTAYLKSNVAVSQKKERIQCDQNWYYLQEAGEKHKRIFDKQSAEMERSVRDQLMQLYLREEEKAKQLMQQILAQELARYNTGTRTG